MMADLWPGVLDALRTLRRGGDGGGRASRCSSTSWSSTPPTCCSSGSRPGTSSTTAAGPSTPATTRRSPASSRRGCRSSSRRTTRRPASSPRCRPCSRCATPGTRSWSSTTAAPTARRNACARRSTWSPVERELPADVPTRAAVLEVLVPRNGRTRLVVVRKENCGRSDAVNVGHQRRRRAPGGDGRRRLDPRPRRAARGRQAVRRRPDPDGGHRRGDPGRQRLHASRRARSSQVRMPGSRLARIQVVEYLRAFLLGRTGWSRFGGR